MTDVLVIGGGIVGQVAAIELAQAGARSPSWTPAQNAGSTANAGSLHVQMQSRFMRLYPDQVPTSKRRCRSTSPLPRNGFGWMRQHGPFELVRKGGLMLAEDAAQLAFLERRWRARPRRACRSKCWTGRALDRIAPWLGPQIIGAELCRDEGKLNPLAANQRLRAVAEGLGVRLRHGSDRRSGQPARRRSRRSGSADATQADRVVVAAAWGAGALTAGSWRRDPVPRRTPAHEHHRSLRDADQSSGPACRTLDHAEAVRHRGRSSSAAAGPHGTGGATRSRSRSSRLDAGERGPGGAACAVDRRHAGHPDMGGHEHDDRRRVGHRRPARP